MNYAGNARLQKQPDCGKWKVRDNPKIAEKINITIPLPGLPQLLFKLIEVCRDSSRGTEEILRIVLLDPAIAVKLMRLAATWSPGVIGVRGIEKIISLLGPGNMRKLALVGLAAPIIRRAMRGSAVKLNQFWRHSILCAVLARKLAERLGYRSPNDTYLAGLVHDIGRLVLWTNFQKEYDLVCRDPLTDAVSPDRENKQFGTNHCEAGWRLVKAAEKRPFAAGAILYHHRPPLEIAQALLHVRIVYAANIICYRKQQPFSLVEIMQSLGVEQTPAQIESLVVEAEHTVERVSRHLGLRPEDPSGADFDQSSETFMPIYEFLRVFRESSLVHITAGDIDPQSGRDTAQKELCLTLQVMFDTVAVFFFYYHPRHNLLIGKATQGYQPDSLVDGLELPVRQGASMAATAVIDNEIVDSFGYLTNGVLSIADEQLLHLLGTEGMVCIPLASRDKRIGVIVAGIDESQFPALSEQMNLLKQFSETAATLFEEMDHSESRDHRIFAGSGTDHETVRRVIHEVNNPLGIIKNYLNILGPKLHGIPEGQEEINLIREEIDRIPGIIQQLTAAGESFGPEAPAAEIVDINNLLYELSKLLQKSVLEPSKIRLHFTLDPKLPPFPGNRGNLVQVFINLLKNSVEAMPQGGNISIRTAYRPKSAENQSGNILIEIQDDGPGIPGPILSRLFEPGKSSKGADNFGLGLSISREIIHRYNGDIQCQTQEGEGTAFQIVLPCHADEDWTKMEKSK